MIFHKVLNLFVFNSLTPPVRLSQHDGFLPYSIKTFFTFQIRLSFIRHHFLPVLFSCLTTFTTHINDNLCCLCPFVCFNIFCLSVSVRLSFILTVCLCLSLCLSFFLFVCVCLSVFHSYCVSVSVRLSFTFTVFLCLSFILLMSQSYYIYFTEENTERKLSQYW